MLAVCALLFACVGQRPGLKTPGQGGAEWLELRSPHFVLRTDLTREQAERVFATLEHRYALLERVIFGGQAPTPLVTQVVAFREESELREFVPPPVWGRFYSRLPNDVEPEPTLLIFGELSSPSRVVFVHELAHRFNDAALGSMPVWANEGLAQYYSTLRGTIDEPIVGEVDPEHGFAPGSVFSRPGFVFFQADLLKITELPKASELLKLDSEGFYGANVAKDELGSSEERQRSARNYAAAWALVHMLMETGSPKAKAFQRAVASGRNFRSVLDQDFGESGSPGLDAEFEAYLDKSMSWRQPPSDVPAKPENLELGKLDDVQVTLLWARLDAFDGNHKARAEKRLGEALKLEPGDADANYWMGRYWVMNGRPRDAEPYFATASDGPANGRRALSRVLLYLSGDTNHVFSDAERDDALRPAAEQLRAVASTGHELNALALYALKLKELEDAARLSERSIEAAPSCWQCWHTAAFTAFQRGDSERAIERQSMAVEHLSSGANPAARKAVKETLAAYRAARTNRKLAKELVVPLYLP